MDTITVSGIAQAVTRKSILLNEAWYSRKYSSILEGYPAKGEWLRLSVPQWLYDKANGNPPAPAKTPSQLGIPTDMLKRLIQLCHPDKHGGSKSATIATEWLLKQREGGA